MNHKIFISYYHKRHQVYKEYLLKINALYNIFEDRSVDTGDIDENLPDEKIRTIIRDKYLADSTVTIVLVGEDTKKRKHIDWEIYSSMYDGVVNKKSGILVIDLAEIDYSMCHSALSVRMKDLSLRNSKGLCQVNDKLAAFGHSARYLPNLNHMSDRTKEVYRSIYPNMPQRIIDNLIREDGRISVLSWPIIIKNPTYLRHWINVAFENRKNCRYDTSKPMRRHNS